MVNEYLAKWDPINLPPEIADVEYVDYVPEIVENLSNKKKLCLCLMSFLDKLGVVSEDYPYVDLVEEINSRADELMKLNTMHLSHEDTFDNMKYLKFVEKRKIKKEHQKSILGNLLWKIISLFIPTANPDFDNLYLEVETWYIEYDETYKEDGTVREVGRDTYGRIIVKDPDDRNYGFWNDTNMGINDFIEQMHAEFITKEEFESAWNEELVKID